MGAQEVLLNELILKPNIKLPSKSFADLFHKSVIDSDIFICDFSFIMTYTIGDCNTQNISLIVTDILPLKYRQFKQLSEHHDHCTYLINKCVHLVTYYLSVNAVLCSCINHVHYLVMYSRLFF